MSNPMPAHLYLAIRQRIATLREHDRCRDNTHPTIPRRRYDDARRMS
jgi:hypothetical protein